MIWMTMPGALAATGPLRGEFLSFRGARCHRRRAITTRRSAARAITPTGIASSPTALAPGPAFAKRKESTSTNNTMKASAGRTIINSLSRSGPFSLPASVFKGPGLHVCRTEDIVHQAGIPHFNLLTSKWEPSERAVCYSRHLSVSTLQTRMEFYHPTAISASGGGHLPIGDRWSAHLTMHRDGRRYGRQRYGWSFGTPHHSV